MPSQSITFDEEQYAYILRTKPDDASVSERVRELVDAGIDAEGGVDG